MKNQVRRLIADQKGATAIEYGLIVSLVVIAMVASLSSVGSVTSEIWNNVSTKVRENSPQNGG
ncbi:MULTISPECIES: Flp family type IVb pilin [unclassified Sphingomonas]|jgi:pilus assembly protein Flp/PilA|uniref:Flp family type IVb pilin n=1 Tax=unclassified Sphingomonas TaxID=196159 RepID=UPI000834300B|nr:MULTISPECIES: Flp family type IVb pilin [unclassified Sphingomonas]